MVPLLRLPRRLAPVRGRVKTTRENVVFDAIPSACGSEADRFRIGGGPGFFSINEADLRKPVGPLPQPLPQILRPAESRNNVIP